MNKHKIGFAMCGSFCTLSKAIEQMEILSQRGHKIVPIMSFNTANIDTRFSKAKDIKEKVEKICDRKIINSISDAEPIGPKHMVDVMIIAPCTGNTLGKLCNGITDTPVTMAAKSHLRVQKPLIIALATNDALGISGQNIGKTLNMKNIYFVPLYQDDPKNKPNSLIADFNLVIRTMELALLGQQMQPVFANRNN